MGSSKRISSNTWQTKKRSDTKLMFRFGGGVVSSASKMHVMILRGYDLSSSKSG